MLSSNRVVEKKMTTKKSEQFTYLDAALISTFGITSMAVMLVITAFHGKWRHFCSFGSLIRCVKREREPLLQKCFYGIYNLLGRYICCHELVSSSTGQKQQQQQQRVVQERKQATTREKEGRCNGCLHRNEVLIYLCCAL